MEYMISFGKWCADVSDYVLLWLLGLPHDLVVLAVALTTVLLLTIARRIMTNQDLLRRCKQDMVKLKQRLKQAKKSKDKATAKNIQMTMGSIQLKQMAAEFKGLALGIIPIIFLASWAFERLGFHPPQVGEEFQLRTTTSLDARNKLAWINIEPEGIIELLPAETASIQRVINDDHVNPFTGTKLAEEDSNGLAKWTFRAAKPGHAVVTIKLEGADRPFVHNVRVGDRHYGDPLLPLNPADAPWDLGTSSLVMRRALFLSWVPGVQKFWDWYDDLAWWMGPAPPTTAWDTFVAYGLIMPVYAVSRITWFPPWLTAYVLLTIPLIPLVRRVLRVY